MSQQDTDNQKPLQPADTRAAPPADTPSKPVLPVKEPLAWDRPPRTPEEEVFEDDFALGDGAREPSDAPNDFDSLEPGPTEVVSFATSSRGRNGRGRDAEPEEVDEQPSRSKGLTGLLADPDSPLFRSKSVAIAIAAAIVALAIILAFVLSSSKSLAPAGSNTAPESQAESPTGGQPNVQLAPSR
ncbi:MAG TPA: hypothetical protein P5137_04315 [Candidatus Brocadiia bacterium]|nr:hypothetical protein [Candidatus Brocadiia bacterium]